MTYQQKRMLLLLALPLTTRSGIRDKFCYTNALKTYPAMFEQPVLREFRVVRVHRHGDLAYILCVAMKSCNFVVHKGVASSLWMYS